MAELLAANHAGRCGNEIVIRDVLDNIRAVPLQQLSDIVRGRVGLGSIERMVIHPEGGSKTGDSIMAYLDLSPMLQAMRLRPSEFEMQGVCLHHIPSHHLLNFDTSGLARVHARCDCAMLEVSRDQSDEIRVAMSAWKVVYWEPHLAQIEAEKRVAKINREFASHFRPPSPWQRFLALFRRRPRFELRFEPQAAAGSEPASATAAHGAPTERPKVLSS
jgi:hypothetical protein